MRKRIKLIDIFIIIVISSLVFYTIVNFITHGGILAIYANRYPADFHDYLTHVREMSDLNSYPNEYLVFPPFAYILYIFLNRSNPLSYVSEYSVNTEMLVFYMLYIFVFIVLIQIINYMLDDYKTPKRTFFIIAVVLSYPVFFTSVMKGNSVLYAAIMIIIAMILAESDNKVYNEIALLLIAFSFGFKIYTAIFGLMYILDKDYKKAIRLLFYGLIVFIAPFFIFDGIATLKKYIPILIGAENSLPSEGSFAGFILFALRSMFGLDITNAKAILVLQLLFLLSCILGCALSKEKWRRLLFLSGIACSFITRVFDYNIVYYSIPFLFFARDFGNIKLDFNNKSVVLNIINIVLFSFIFSMWFFQWGKLVPFTASFALLFINLVYVCREKLSRV